MPAGAGEARPSIDADALRADPRSSPVLRELVDVLGSPEAATTVPAAEAWDVHVADAFSGLDVPAVRAAGTLADLGSGAGVPGLVLAAALPGCHVFLVESARRKADFVAEAARRCGLFNATSVWSRAEAWDAGRGSCDVVTARALAALPVLCEYAAPLLRPGGTLVCWKGAVDPAEAAAGRAAAEVLGLSTPTVSPVVPFPGSRDRTLWTFRLEGSVPTRFPRRPGMAVKRPLGA